MITSHGLLYIEPKQRPSQKPTIDDYTRRMAAALSHHTIMTGVLCEDGAFLAGITTKGYYICSCGARSSVADYRLPNGMVTNSLAVHYLAWHRSEVPAAHLALVSALAFGAIEPSAQQLQTPRGPR